MKLTQNQSQIFKRDGLDGWNYKLPDVEGGVSIVLNKLTGVHVERNTEETTRIYFIIEGKGIFKINNNEETVAENDVIVIPPHSIFNFWATDNTTLKCVLFTNLLDIPR
jgi:mannose-6-phosphate isomerase-like protein (cupin superfamily)